MAVDAAAIARTADAWRTRFESLPRPIAALLIGGPTGGLRFDLPAARRLLAASLSEVGRRGGSLYVTTSRRTPPEVVAMLERERPPGARLHVFDPGAPPGENPYQALLGLADDFFVTTDSLSMMIEVVRLGKALALFPLAPDAGRVERALERIGWLPVPDPRRDPIPAGGVVARALHRLGLPVHSRDLSAIPRRLVERGLARWLGDPPIGPSRDAVEEVTRVAVRVRDLVEGRTGAV
jgi:hypothetical protein